MIESKQQLLSAFSSAARGFRDQPNAITGIELDDAAVALKRYVLNELHDQSTASLLAGFAKGIRTLDTESVAQMVADVEQRLA